MTAVRELIALDTAGYGPIPNVNKAISIATVPGATAFVVVAAGTTGFPINAGVNDLVILRNISRNGSGAANTTGVQHTSGKLFIQNCGFTQLTNGFSMNATLATLADISHSSFTGNTKGVNVTGGQLNMDNCVLTKNTMGVSASGGGLCAFRVHLWGRVVTGR